MRVGFLAQDFPDGAQIQTLMHPKTMAKVPFVVTPTKLFEIVEIVKEPSSFMVGNQIVSDGNPILMVEMNPMFIVLSYLMDYQTSTFSISSFCELASIKPIKHLIESKIHCICSISEENLIRFDMNKVHFWLWNRLEKIIPQISQQHGGDLFYVSSICCDILKHYLRVSLANEFEELVEDHSAIMQAVPEPLHIAKKEIRISPKRQKKLKYQVTKRLKRNKVEVGTNQRKISHYVT